MARPSLTTYLCRRARKMKASAPTSAARYAMYATVASTPVVWAPGIVQGHRAIRTAAPDPKRPGRLAGQLSELHELHLGCRGAGHDPGPPELAGRIGVSG